MTYQEKRIVEVHIPSELGYEKVAMAAAATLAQKMGFSEDSIEDLKTAVGEACTNAIEYGNELNSQEMVVVVFSLEEDRIQVNVIDNGHKPIPTSPPDRAARDDFRGLGMSLIQQLMDKVVIKSRPGRNEIRMINHLNSLKLAL